jgi:hypothetical protein
MPTKIQNKRKKERKHAIDAKDEFNLIEKTHFGKPLLKVLEGKKGDLTLHRFSRPAVMRVVQVVLLPPCIAEHLLRDGLGEDDIMIMIRTAVLGSNNMTCAYHRVAAAARMRINRKTE